MAPNYQNGKVYSIRSYKTDKIYIGSTTQSLSVRFGGHKAIRNQTTSKLIILQGDAYIELIELYSCNSKEELHKKEGEHIRANINIVVNKYIAGRTDLEYKQSEKGIARQKEYRLENAEKNKAYQTAYKQTDAGKEARKAYTESEKGKNTKKLYLQSEENKRKSNEREKTEKCKATRKAYSQSEVGKLKDKAYRQTEEYKRYKKEYKIRQLELYQANKDKTNTRRKELYHLKKASDSQAKALIS